MAMNSIRMKKMILKLSLGVLILGITMIWIMAPTKVYRQRWIPKIRAKANTTYFESQGATMLEFTFPMLLVATLGCVYLHLGKKSDDNRNDGKTEINYGLSAWKRPFSVNTPLGVVSWTEMVFAVMFLVLLVWSFGSYLHMGFSQITRQSARDEYGEKVWEARLDIAAERLGNVGNICLALLFFPVTRGSSILPLLGLTSEASIKYHIWLGHVTMVLFTAHGLLYIVLWGLTHQLSEMLKWSKTGVSNVAGELSLLAGLALWATTFPRIRRKMFEVFFYTHHLYILFMVFFVYHLGIAYVCIMLPGLYLFMIDRYLRFLQSRKNVCLLSARILPCETVELNFSKSLGLEYSPTSILFVNVPGISRLQWHPFTITSNSNLEQETLSIVIKQEGRWSQKLYEMLSRPPSVERLEVAVEGPYGPATTNYLRHDILVMVSGGSGITPFFSIIRELIFLSTTKNMKTPQIRLVSAFRHSDDLAMLDLVLPITRTPFDVSHLQLLIEAYVTREKQQQQIVSTDDKSVVRTMWFKPNPSDQPVSAILGTNNWLWLGAIIACSFVIYLITLSLITRFYIYPIDHNTNRLYSTASRATISMLLVCLSIALTSSAVVYKNKNRHARESNQVREAERELESFPSESLVRATNVHYGSRPNLKKILLGIEGSNVGVLVSGPRQMRHEVAAICSSGLADNLRFESMSFSW